MHAQHVPDLRHDPASPPLIIRRPLVPLNDIRAGQHFVRTDSPSEVLVLATWAGGGFFDPRYTWAVVVAVNHDSEGYVPGQLLRLLRATRVRVLHEAAPAVFALEQ